jgi:SAM-dependent methyltransferase
MKQAMKFLKNGITIPKNCNNFSLRLIKGIKRRGILDFTTIVFMRTNDYIVDFWFDFKNRTDTRSLVDLNKLCIMSDNKEFAWTYQPTSVLALRKLFDELNVPNNSILLDIGCGKGRVLMIASEFGFKEVRGVDFSPELCKIATYNCQKFKEKTQNTVEFRIYESDIIDYQIKSDENVFYLFNPFEGKILDQVLDNIQLSLSKYPRKVQIIYHNPEYHHIFEHMHHYIKEKEFCYDGRWPIFVYTNEF